MTKKTDASAPPTGETLGPCAPTREVWQDVPEYPGFTAKLWSNYPQTLANDIANGGAPLIPALRQIVLAHNGWRDHQGVPYPDAQAEDFYDAIPTELGAVLIRLTRTVVWDLPNSLARTTPRASSSG